MENNKKRKISTPQRIRRTDNASSYVGPSTSHVIYVPSDTESEAEENRLNREVSDLYQQIKIKKERIEKIRIARAVRKAKIETEQRIRRETKWLPTLDKVTEVQKQILDNLSSDSDDDEYKFDDLPSVEELFDAINPSGKLNDVE